MSLSLLIQLLINGISSGLLYALVALGLILVLGVAKIFNFSHGESYMFGAYGFYLLYIILHLNFVVSLILCGVIVGLIGTVCGRFIFRYISGSLLRAAAVTVGMGLIFRQVVLQGFGTATRAVSSIFPGTITIGDTILIVERMVLIGCCLLIVGLLGWFLKKTKTGMAMRATNLDEETASLQGIDTFRMYIVAITVGCGLAGLAGAIIAPILALSPDMGQSMLFLVLMVIILGGMQSAFGAILGGLILGLALSFGFQFIGGMSELATFFITGFVIMLKPHGLFGRPIEV